MNNDIKQLLKFYGLIYPETWANETVDQYTNQLEQLVNIQAQQIERLQERLRKVEPQKPMNEHHKTRIA